MAKKSDTSKFLEKEYKGSFQDVGYLVNTPKQVIPFSPKMDTILGGGIPEGSFVVFTGPPKVGKSTAALQFCANAQMPEFGNRKIYYANIEGRLKRRDVLGIRGLNLDKDKFQVIGSNKEKILYNHDYIDIALHLLKHEQNIVIILDSVSQLCSEEKASESVSKQMRDSTAIMLSSFTKQAANILPVNNNIVISITHLIANQGQGMSLWSEASGRKIQYQVDVKLKAQYSSPYTVGEEQLGQTVHWLCETNSLTRPMMKCQSLLRYGIGIDHEYDLIELGSEIGIIEKAGGGWTTFPDGTKVHGLEQASNYLRKNPDIYNGLYKQIRDLMGL